jgi:hypothetical protein
MSLCEKEILDHEKITGQIEKTPTKSSDPADVTLGLSCICVYSLC